MPSEAFLPGFVLYLLEIFAPGIGLGELLNVWGDQNRGLTHRVGYAFGLGLATDTVVLMVQTSGFSIGGHVLRGIGSGTLYFIIALGAAALAVSYVRRRKFLMPVKPTATDAAVLGVTAILVVVVVLFFEAFPIFPEFPGEDFGVHVQIAQELIAGTMTTFPRGVLYYGVHYQLASALIFVGGEPLVTVRLTMALLVILSPALTYAVSARLFSSSSAGMVAAAAYVFSSSIWFDSVFNSGLYANFFGLLIALFFLAALLDVSQRFRSVEAWIFFLIVVIAVYFSHYTTVTLLPGVLIAAAVQFWKSKTKFKELMIPSLVTIAPGLAVAVISPRTVRLVIYLGEQAVGVVSGSTTISAALAFFPALSYLAIEVDDDIAFIFLFVFAAICVYRFARSQTTVVLILVLWCATLLIAAPDNVSAWRFSYEVLLPLTLLAALGIYSLLPRLKIQRRRKGGSNALSQYAKVGAVCLLLISPIAIGSWATTSVSYDVGALSVQPQSQQNVYTALYWLKDNTPTNSSYLSVSDWRFLYSVLFFGRNTTYIYFPEESEAISYAQQHGYGYIVVTQLSTLSLPEGYAYPWSSYQANSNATIVYTNPDVEIFQISGVNQTAS